jgi:hypothetical protein
MCFMFYEYLWLFTFPTQFHLRNVQKHILCLRQKTINSHPVESEFHAELSSFQVVADDANEPSACNIKCVDFS